MPKTLPAEHRQRCGDAVQNAFDVDLDHVLALLNAQVVEGRDRPNAGIVDENVKFAVSLTCHLIRAETSSRRLTSVSAQDASPPAPAMRAARASRRSDPRAPGTTFAPRSASSSAVASPIPLLAPVIATTLPWIPDEVCIFVSLLADLPVSAIYDTAKVCAFELVNRNRFETDFCELGDHRDV